MILVDGAGNAVEGPGFNVFAVEDGGISTPEAGADLLAMCATYSRSNADRKMSPESVLCTQEQLRNGVD